MIKYFTHGVKGKLVLLAAFLLLSVWNNKANAQCQGCWAGNNGAAAPTPACGNQTMLFGPTCYQYFNLTGGASYTFSVAPGTGWTTPWVEVYYYNGSAWTCAGSGSSAITVNPMPAANVAGNYIVVVNNGHACYGAWPGANSATLTYTQNNNLSCSTSATELCSNGSTTTINVAPAGGTTSLNAGVGSVSGTTYTAPSTTTAGSASVHYVMGSCAVNSSNIQIDAQSIGGTVTQNPTSGSHVCNGNGVTYTLSGQTGTFNYFQYQWNASPPNSGTWGTTNPYTWTASLNGASTLYVDAVVTNGVCPAAVSNIVNSTVDAPSVGGTITQSPATGTHVCNGSPVVYTLSGQTGTFNYFQYQWNASPPNSGSWGTSNPYTWTSGLNGASILYVDAVVTNGVCPSTISNIVNVTVDVADAITSVTAAANPICGESTTLLTANGVSGTSATVNWYTGTGATGNSLGTGTTLTVGGDQTYYARVTGGVCPAAEANLAVATETTVPTITAPAAISTNNSPNNSGSAAEAFAAPTGSDNCAGEWAGGFDLSSASGPLSTVASNLKLWCKGDAGVVKDGSGNVSEWRDISGSGNKFYQPTFTARPTRTASSASFNNYPVLSFTTAQTLPLVTSLDGGANSTFTMFVVERLTGTNARLCTSANANNWLLGSHGGYEERLYCNNWITAATPAADALGHMYEVSSNSTTTNGTSLYDYGVLQATGTAGAPNGPGQLQFNGWSGELSTGEVAEVIYYNTILSTAQRQIVEGYLAYKYNLPCPLASLQAFQAFAGTTTYGFIGTDQSGNKAVTTQTASKTTYPGPTIAASATPVCQGTNVTLTTSGMSPAGSCLTTGVNSSAYLLVGTSTSASNVTLGTTWTLASWVKFPLPANPSWNTLFRGINYHPVIFERTQGATNAGVIIGTHNGAFYPASGASAANGTTIASNSSLGQSVDVSSLSGWHHIAASGTGGTTSFYVDGVYVGRSASQVQSDNVVAVGNYQGAGQDAGTMDEVKIYNVALGQNAISNLMTQASTSTSDPNWNNLVAYYKMDASPVVNSSTGTAACSSCNGTVQSGAVAGSTATAFYTYTWSGPGSPTLLPSASSTTESVTISGPTNANSGSYTCIASANGISSTTTNKTVQVDALPVLTVPTAVCTNGTAALSSSVSVNWSVSSGTVNTATGTATTFTPAAIIAPTQNQTITITAVNGTCTSNTNTIRVDNLNSISAPSANPSPVCDNSTLAITGTISGVVWTQSPSIGTIATSPGQSVIFTPTALTGTTQNATTTITATNGVCTAQNLNVRVDHHNAITSPVANPSPVCDNSILAIAGTVAGVVWTMSPSIGSIATTPGQNVTFTPTALTGTTQNATTTITATNGVCAAQTLNVRVDHNTSSVSAPVAICTNGTAAVTSSVAGVSWTTSAGSVSPLTGQNTTLTPGAITAPTQSQNVTVTATNGSCAATATVRVDNLNSITTAPPTVCNSTTAAFAGNISGVTWSSTSGSMSGAAQNATFTPAAITAPTASQNATITATNGVCTAPTAVIRVDNQNVITSPPSAICDASGTVALSGTISGVVWSVAMSGNITGSSINSPGQNATLTPGSVSGTNANANITVTATNGSCTATKTIQVDHGPTAVVATPSQAQCNNANFSLVATQNTFGTGTWSCTGNCTGVTINNPNSYNTASASGIPVNTTTTVQWAISNGTCSSSTTETLRNDNQAGISGSTALCVADPNMQFNSSGAGTNPTPVWSVTPSSAGSITSGGLFTANAISGSTVSIPVTINLTNGTCLSTYSTTLWNSVNIVPISNMCETSPAVVVSAKINNIVVYGDPTNGPTFTGTGGTVTWNAGTSRYMFTPPAQAGNSTNYNITVRAGSDSYCSDFQTVTVFKNTSASNAGTNQAQCNNSTFTLAGNNPAVGVGTWTISGTGTITNSAAFNSTVTGVPAGTTATLTWTIVNGSCNSSSQVTLHNDASVTPSNAGSAFSSCTTTATLAGNNPTVGTGAWTQTAGPGTTTFGNAALYNSSTSVTAYGTYTYQWLITNGTCSSSSTVNVTYNQAPADIVPTVQSNPLCAGTGTNIQLSNSVVGVSYQLQIVTTGNGTTTYTNVSGSVANGNGSATNINLATGNLAATDTFSVLATVTATGCQARMITMPIVVVGGPDFAIGALMSAGLPFHIQFGANGNTTLPTGWTAAANTPTSGGLNWVLSSASRAAANTYFYVNTTGAGLTANSTGAYITTPTGSPATPVELILPDLITTGYSNISVYWGAQKSTGYTGTVLLKYSTDGGTTWTSANFIDVQNNVTNAPWAMVNNKVEIKLPLAATNISNLKLKWVANPSTTGFYSINDICIVGLQQIKLCAPASLSVTYNSSCSLTKYDLSGNTWPSFSAVTNVPLGANIVSNIVYPAIAAGTYNLDLTLKTASGGSGGTINFPVTYEPVITVTPNLENCSCMSGSAYQMVSVYATGGVNGNFTFTPINGSDLLKTTYTGGGVPQTGSASGVKGIFWSVADHGLHQYTVGDANCTVTVSRYTQNSVPADVLFSGVTHNPVSGAGNGIQGSYNNGGANIASITNVNGPALTCHQTKDFGDTWVTYIANNMDPTTGVSYANDTTNNKVAVEINNRGNVDLDSVSVSVYREPLLPSVPNLTGPAGACYQFPEYAMERHFVIQSSKSHGANSFPSDVGVRLYFSDAELKDLIYWTNYAATQNAGGVNASCASAQIVNNTGMIYVTKFTGLYEDGDYTNNHNDPSGLYRMFGPNTTAAGNGPSYFDGANGNGTFGNGLGANRHFVEMNVREFSEFWLHGSGDIEPLPVEMIYFEAEAVNNEYIHLDWATDIEINNKEFQVERSTDGQNWSQIGTVEGHGNSTVKLTYSYDDKNVVANTRYYYRLKQVDFNLSFKYTGVVSAMIYGNGAFSVSLSPNPTYGNTNLIINTTKDQDITVDVYDVIGQRMVTANNQLTSGYNRIGLDLGHLASGTYTVTITSANQMYTKKLVITK